MHIHGHRISFTAAKEHIHNDGFCNAVKYLFASKFTGAKNVDKPAPDMGEGVVKDTAINPHAAQTVNINRPQAEVPSTEYCQAIKRSSTAILQLAEDGNMKGEFRIAPENDILNSQSASMIALTEVSAGTGAIIKRFVLDHCKFSLDILTEQGREEEQAQAFMEGFQTKINSLPSEIQSTLKDIFAMFGKVLKQNAIKPLEDFDPTCITMICDRIAELPMPTITTRPVDQSMYVLSTAAKDAFISYCTDLDTGSKATMDNVISA